MTDTINKQKLVDFLDVEIDLSSGNSEVEKADRWAFRLIKKEVESGRLDEPTPSTPVQGYREALEKAERFISSIMSFYGKNLEVMGWHQNGNSEPWDNFFDENMDGDELDLIRQALSQTDIQPSGWIPVSTPPKEREWYLVTDEGAVSYGRWHGNGWNIENSPVLYDVTHWMPLPPPPGINSTEDDQPGPSISSTRLMLDKDDI